MDRRIITNISTVMKDARHELVLKTHPPVNRALLFFILEEDP